jgi:PAS domain S-box-containing protein
MKQYFGSSFGPSFDKENEPLPILSGWVKIGFVALVYFVTARLGLMLDAVSGFATLIWPPSGIGLAALVLCGRHLWPGLFLGAVLANLSVGAPLLTAVGIGVGNSLESLFGCWLLSKADFNHGMRRIKDVMLLIGLGALVSTSVSAILGVSTLLLSGLIKSSEIGKTGIAWWVGDAISVELVAPLIFVWCKELTRKRRDFPSILRILETAVLTTLSALISFFSFYPFFTDGPLKEVIGLYMLSPLYVWAALRYGQRGLLLSVVVSLLFAIAAIVLSGGAEFGAGSLNLHFIRLQLFVGVSGLTGMVLAAVLSEREDTAKQAEEYQQRLDQVQRAAEVASWEWDMQTNKVVWAGALQQVYGSIPADRETWLQQVYPEDREKMQDAIKRTDEGLGDLKIEFRFQRIDGSVHWLEARGNIVTAFGNDVSRRFVGINFDITEQKRIKAELITAKESAEQMSQYKSAFLANMSHEIRTPLGAILGFTELLKNPNLQLSDRSRYIDIICRNGQNLTKLIDDILDLSKVEAGRLEIENVKFSLHSLLADVHSLLNLKAQDKGLYLHFVYEGDVPEQIISDPTRLRQVLTNVVGNAIKFTNTGGVTVTVRSEAAGEKPTGHFISFAVHDTGLGIPIEFQDRLFKTFTQTDSSTTRKYGGTGLGLALSQKLAKALGGDVVLKDSSSDSGSLFEISIKVLSADSVAVQGATHEHPQAKEKAAQFEVGKNQLANIKILLVEDSPDNQLLLETMLTNCGATVQIANNGEEGVTQALKGSFDVVLMDIQMPVLDGYEATRRLRRQGYSKPILALSAHALIKDREASLSIGCNDHLVKPVDPEALIASIQKVCFSPSVAEIKSINAVATSSTGIV